MAIKQTRRTKVKETPQDQIQQWPVGRLVPYVRNPSCEPAEVQTSLARPAWKTAALTEDDARRLLPPQPVARVGRVWVIGPHRVGCGDNTETGAGRMAISRQENENVY